jgi:hypothetical protein
MNSFRADFSMSTPVYGKTCVADLRVCLRQLTLMSQNNGLPRALPRYARAALNCKPQGGDKQLLPGLLDLEQLLPGLLDLKQLLSVLLDDVQFPGRLLDNKQFPGGLLVNSWLQNLHVGVRCCHKN